MNNLTQQQRDAKQAFLDKQLEQTIAHYENADSDEKKAVIKQVDSILKICRYKDEMMFWLKFRYKLERLCE